MDFRFKRSCLCVWTDLADLNNKATKKPAKWAGFFVIQT